MSKKPRPTPDRMSFLEHLDELRRRLVRGLLSLVVAFAACWGFHEQIFRFLIQPLKKAYPAPPGTEGAIQLIYTAPAEGFFLYMKMCFFVGIFLAAPFILYQVWAFISPGLYRHEKMYVIPFIFFGSLFFAGGAVFGHYFLFPATFKFLGEFAGTEMKFLPRVAEYFSFYSWFLLGLGLVFQLPVVIFILARIGLVTAGFLLRKFKWAVLAAFVVAALITPTPDVVTQTALALPMLGLYLLGVAVAAIFGKPRRVPKQSVSVEARTG